MHLSICMSVSLKHVPCEMNLSSLFITWLLKHSSVLTQNICEIPDGLPNVGTICREKLSYFDEYLAICYKEYKIVI